MLKYVKVDSDGYAYLPREHQSQLHKLGYHVGRANNEWLLFRVSDPVTRSYRHELVFDTTDHVLLDNYLKLLLED